jgi:hypothetical protein
MKILDVPQCGKRGVTVSQGGRYGQISRALVIPTNPRTPAQMLIRNRLSGVAAQWRQLSQEQRDAWTAAAKSCNSKPSDGQSGTLTGSQLFTKINVALLTIGAPVVTDPPAKPAVAINPITGLTITSAGGVVTLKLTATDAPSDGTMLRVAAPVSAGRSSPGSYVYAGTLDSMENGAVDITALYKAKFGSPPVGSKVFVSVNQNSGGWEDIPHMFMAIVPAGA